MYIVNVWYLLQWCIRYTPVTVEMHNISITVKDKDGTRNIGSVTFDVTKVHK